jgi:type II secretory pathway component PulC
LESGASPYNKYWEKTDGDRLPNTHSIPSLKTGRWPHYPPRGVDLSFLGKGCGECMESQTESGSIPLFYKAPAQASCETHRAINTVTDTFDKLLSNFCNILSGGFGQLSIWGAYSVVVGVLYVIYKIFCQISSSFSKYILLPSFIYIGIFLAILVGRLSYLMFNKVEPDADEQDEYTCNIKFPDIDTKADLDQNTGSVLLIITFIYILTLFFCIILFIRSIVRPFHDPEGHSEQIRKERNDNFLKRREIKNKKEEKSKNKKEKKSTKSRESILGGRSGITINIEDQPNSVMTGGSLDIKNHKSEGKSSKKSNQKLNKYNKWLLIILLLFAMIITHYYKKNRNNIENQQYLQQMKDKQNLQHLQHLQQMKENRSSKEIKQAQPISVFGGQYL